MKSDIPIPDPQGFIDHLASALQKNLPGYAAQAKMAPPNRINQGEIARRSAVLILIYPSTDGEMAIPFTLRPVTLAHHAGEVCFPGGGTELADTSLTATALREAREELGISPSEVNILGALTPLYIAGSQNIVHPYVGWMPYRPLFHPDPREVERVLEITLQYLLDPQIIGSYEWRHAGRVLTAPCFRTGDICIWGATAMMLNELLEIIHPRRREQPQGINEGA